MFVRRVYTQVFDNFYLGKIYLWFRPGVGGGGGVTPYNGLYGEAPPERGTFFRLQVYKRVGISQAEVYKRVGISQAEVYKRVGISQAEVYKRVGIPQAEVYKRVAFHKLRYIKGWGNQSFRYLKELLIKIFRIDAPYGCISLFIKHFMKMRTRLPFSAVYS